ncbi:uncharacterized protein LACBIDRAFT_293385 [Laccaria bicolor S238N-H82]|uniref:Predicted protein n=1 Tax=Laccaria bicolor (strain S238N-H82 / ATCC MYA-4686) TaxID=486041 RepID=B0D3D0_LACBS|nr:uncharacterized protein LACBIDRAFT_293385 [Laccaria bicolor S238N-H82]EDR11258.1 predicted protein [Laccaria bicolor S238N-H82]|eukprot:XP_001878559.1 predicted protein [Laccaria bicolor S238N-H82]
MPVASHGALRASARKATNGFVHVRRENGPGGTSRSIHIPPHQPFNSSTTRGTLKSSPTLAQIRPRTPAHKLFSFSRNLLTRLFTHLTAPGLRAPHLYTGNVESLQPARGFATTIQNNLSTGARFALKNRSIGKGTFLPRAPPTPATRVATTVGLGCTRNFSSARPLFQNLVDNVPIAVRALYEAADEWDSLDSGITHKGVKKMRVALDGKKQNKKSLGAQRMKPVKHTIKIKTHEDEMEHYFPAPRSNVTTNLLIPLAPTPTARLPLSSEPESTQHPLLPLPLIGSIHASHSRHALRVSTVFTRLDQSNVWARGVKCSAYSQGHTRKLPSHLISDEADAEQEEGVCTVLKVTFEGWSKAEVRSVIGESGTGWCVLEEVRHDDPEDEGMADSVLDSISEGEEPIRSMWSSPSPSPAPTSFDMGLRESETQLIFPTLDFSSSFLKHNASRNASSESVYSDFEMGDDPWMDCASSDSLRSASEGFIVDPPSENGWFGVEASASFGFSSQFNNARDSELKENLFF